MKKLLILLIALMFNISTSFASIYYYTSLEGIVNGADSGLFCDLEDGNCNYDSDLDVSLSFDEESTYLELGVEKTIPYIISGADVDIVTLSISSENEELMDSSTLIIDTENKIITIPAENINQSGEVRIVLQAKDSDGEVVAQDYTYLNIETISSKNMLTLWTVSAGETVQFPFNSSYFTYKYSGHVDWGDDSEIETFEDTKIQDLTHTYTEAGTYEIRIDGSFYDENSFYGMFQGKTILSGMDISHWNISNVYEIRYMFYNTIIPAGFDISSWDFSTLRNTEDMFLNANFQGDIIYNTKVSENKYKTFLQTLVSPINKFPSSTTSQKIVAGSNACSSDNKECLLARRNIISKGWIIEDTTVDVELEIDKTTALESRWTVSAGEIVAFPMAYSYSGIIDWGDGTIENVDSIKNTTHTYTDAGVYTTWMNGSWGSDFSYLFNGVSLPSNFDISSWNTSTITNMWGMFYNATISSGFDISSWDVSNVTNFVVLFKGATIPKGFNVNTWDTSKVKNLCAVFASASLPDGFNVGNWDTSGVYDMAASFEKAINLTSSIGIHNWNVSNNQSLAVAFLNVTIPDKFSFAGWDLAGMTTFTDMFSGATISGDLVYDETVSSGAYSIFVKMLAHNLSSFPDSTTGQKIYVGDNTCGSDADCIAAETTLTNKGWVITRTTAN